MWFSKKVHRVTRKMADTSVCKGWIFNSCTFANNVQLKTLDLTNVVRSLLIILKCKNSLGHFQEILVFCLFYLCQYCSNRCLVNTENGCLDGYILLGVRKQQQTSGTHFSSSSFNIQCHIPLLWRGCTFSFFVCFHILH